MPDYGRRVIVHVDMNAFFASVEQKTNPFLRGKPIAVVGDSRRRTVCMTASYEARAFGVKTGMNMRDIKLLCPNIILVDGNADKYMDATLKILKVLESFSDQVEMTSCDEAYLDVTGSLKFFGTGWEGLGQMIRQQVRQAVGLPCSVGVAPNKLLAKLASDKKKPDGLTVIYPHAVEQLLAETAVEDLCGVGYRLKESLNRHGIKTCKDLGDKDLGYLQYHFGFWGYWFKRMGQGIDHDPVKGPETKAVPAKSVGHSSTFPRDVSDRDLLRSYLQLLSEKVAMRMRQGQYQGRVISLYVRWKDFTHYATQEKQADYTDDGYVIYRAALKLFEQLLPLPKQVRLFGVRVSNLISTQWQEYLFAVMDKRRQANHVQDEINTRWGEGTIYPASEILAHRWGLLHWRISPRFKPDSD